MMFFVFEVFKYIEMQLGIVLIFFFLRQYIKGMKVFGNWGIVNDYVLF